jgi:hypothetical protein
MATSLVHHSKPLSQFTFVLGRQLLARDVNCRNVAFLPKNQKIVSKSGKALNGLLAF